MSQAQNMTMPTYKELNASRKRWTIVGVIVAIITLTLAYLYWKADKTWQASINPFNQIHAKPFLPAERLLTQHDYTFHNELKLTHALTQNLPNGVLMMGSAEGYMNDNQVASILKWVEQGNVYVTSPNYAYGAEPETAPPDSALPASTDAAKDETRDKAEDTTTDPATDPTTEVPSPSHADAGESLDEDSHDEENPPGDNHHEPDDKNPQPALHQDPINQWLGVGKVYNREFSKQKEDETKKIRQQAGEDQALFDSLYDKWLAANLDVKIRLPHVTYPLHITKSDWKLVDRHSEKPYERIDEQGQLFRLYRHGKGYIVVLADSIFEGKDILNFDHAETLLAITALSSTGKHFTLVQYAEVPTWLELLWSNFSMFLLLLLAFLLLLAWRACVRFGPMLPPLETHRRALIEHIEAAGRWAWKHPDGNDELLQEVRATVIKILQKRDPKLLTLTLEAQIEKLADISGLSQTDIALAWTAPAHDAAAIFTQQIQILKMIRTHYEHAFRK